MDDVQNGAVFQGQQAGQPVQSSAVQPQEQPAGTTPQSYITRDEALQLIQEAQKRNAQSTRDIVDSRVNKAIEARIAQTQQVTGVPLTPQQVETVKAQVIAEQSQEPPSGMQAAQPATGIQAQTLPANPTVEQVNQAAQRLINESGVIFDQNDPEVGMVVTNQSAEVYLSTLQRALSAKQAREQQAAAQQARAQTPLVGGPAKPGNPISDITDIDSLYAMAKQRR